MAAKKTRAKSRQLVKNPRPTRGDATAAIVLAVLLIAAVFAVFQPTLGGGFVYDDTDYVLNNPNVQHGISAQSIRWAFTAFHSANWHPLTWLSHTLDVSFYGIDHAMGHHLTNVILHALNVVLLFWLLWRMTGALWRSAFVAALFGLHPLHVESVAWVSERKDVVSTLFWLLTMAAYLRYTRRPSLAGYAAVFASLALGLMAKPMLVSLPIVLLLMDWWPLKRTGWRLVWEKAPLFALSAASCAVTIAAQRAVGAVVPTDVYPFATRAANALVAYATYLQKAFLPSGLAAYYPYIAKPDVGQILISVIVILAVSALAFRLARSHRYLAVGWFWYLVTMVPVIGLVQVGGQSMADRYTYVPLIGIFIVLAWGLPELARRALPSTADAGRAKALGAAAGVALVLLSVAARQQAGYWKDTVTLWERAVAVTDNNDFAEYSLGIALRQRQDFEQARRHFAESLRIQPNRAQAHSELGSILWADRKTEEAAREFSEALRLDPACVDAHNNMGTYLASKGKYAEAAQEYIAAIRLRPTFAPAHLNLAWAYYCLGKYNEAWDEVDLIVRYGGKPADGLLKALSSKAPRRAQ